MLFFVICIFDEAILAIGAEDRVNPCDILFLKEGY
jgi:hypothetical protein